MEEFGNETPANYATGGGSRLVFTREDYLKAIEEDLIG